MQRLKESNAGIMNLNDLRKGSLDLVFAALHLLRMENLSGLCVCVCVGGRTEDGDHLNEVHSPGSPRENAIRTLLGKDGYRDWGIINGVGGERLNRLNFKRANVK